MNQGILYCCYGKPKFMAFNIMSIITLRQHYKGIISVVCREYPERLFELYDVNHILMPEEDFIYTEFYGKHYYPKTQLMKYTPYLKTLYLDGDTIINQPIDDLFQYSGLAMVEDIHYHEEAAKCSGEEVDRMKLTIPLTSKYYNGGVMLFDKSTKQLDGWEEEWDVYQKGDDQALNTLFQKRGVWPRCIPYTFNTLYHQGNVHFPHNAIIHHINRGVKIPYYQHRFGDQFTEILNECRIEML